MTKSCNFNLSSIMRDAHQIRRDAAKKHNLPVSSILFSECLKMAWNRAKHAHKTDLVVELASCTDITRLIGGMTVRAIKDRVGRSVSENNGRDQAIEHLAKCTEAEFLTSFDMENLQAQTAYDLVRLVNDTARIDAINGRRYDRGLKPITLGYCAWQAATNALNKAVRDSIKQARIGSLEVTTANGDTMNMLNIVNTAQRDEYSEAITQIDLKRACKDAVDMQILSMLYDDMRQVDIAAVVGISQQAVNKRIKALARRYSVISA